VNEEQPIAIELDCETGIETIRPLTAEEQAQRLADAARAESERAAKEAEEAAKQAEREALSAWLLSRSDLTDGARAAILNALQGAGSAPRAGI
jgi:vacuolar-type H+-ATPase subunit E/Vma4